MQRYGIIRSVRFCQALYVAADMKDTRGQSLKRVSKKGPRLPRDIFVKSCNYKSKNERDSTRWT